MQEDKRLPRLADNNFLTFFRLGFFGKMYTVRMIPSNHTLTISKEAKPLLA